MNKITISATQLYSLMILFLTGSTLIIGLNFTAKQDSVIAVIIELFIGILLFYFYLLILLKSSWKEFIPLLQMGFGTFIARILGVLYSLYFLYIAGLVMMDFSFFVTNIMLLDSPNWVVVIPFLFVVGYSLILGFEAIARSSEILMFIFITFLPIIWLLGFFSDEFDPKYLVPLFSEGWRSISEVIFPSGLTFPFGELIVFLVLLPYVKNVKTVKKFSWLPITISAFIIIITMELVIGILHAPFASSFYYPFVKAMEMVSYLNMIEHFEVVLELLLLAGVFIKVTVYLYCARVTLYQVFKIKKQNIWHILLLLAFMYGGALFKSTNMVEQLYLLREQVPYFFNIPFQFVIPFLLGLIIFGKTHGMKRKN